MEPQAPSANRQIARAAGVVMGAFVISNLVGLLRQMLITRAFGTSAEIDAFYTALTYPDLIFALVAGGALASAFVPTFTGFLAQEKRQDAWQLAAGVANLIFLILVILSLLSSVFAVPVVRYLLAPELAAPQILLSAELLRILMLAPAIFGLSGLVMGILNAHQRFLLPALAPSMYGLGMIFGVLFLAPAFGIHGLAWGAVLGALLHLLIQVPALIKLPDIRYRFSLGLSNPAVREVARLMGPRLFGVAAVQLNFVVNTRIATSLATGSLTAIRVGWQVMAMPQVVIAQAIAIAALPTFSAQVARGELGEMRSSLAATLRSVILLALPASLGLILLRRPITALLFQGGRFDAASTDLVAWALLWYAAGLVGHSVVEIVSRAFYALHDTKTPVLVGASAMGLNVVFSLLFSAWFASSGWYPHGGLALANSLATALEMVVLSGLMRRRLGGIEGSRILKGTLSTLLAALVMGAVIQVWLIFTAQGAAWIAAAGGIVLGLAAFLGMVFLLRIPEATAFLSLLRQRLARVKPGV